MCDPTQTMNVWKNFGISNEFLSPITKIMDTESVLRRNFCKEKSTISSKKLKLDIRDIPVQERERRGYARRPKHSRDAIVEQYRCARNRRHPSPLTISFCISLPFASSLYPSLFLSFSLASRVSTILLRSDSVAFCNLSSVD